MAIARWNKSLRAGHAGECADFSAAAGLPEDGDVAGIAAEIRDVIAHPLERLDAIEHAHVARLRILRAAQIRQVQVAEYVEPVVHCHHYDVMLGRQVRSAIHLPIAGTRRIAAAVEPHHHRPLAAAGALGPHIHMQTIFRARAVGLGLLRHRFRYQYRGVLRRGRAHLKCIANSGPALDFRGRQEAPGAFRRRPVRNAFEHADLALDCAAQLARGGVDHRPCSVAGRRNRPRPRDRAARQQARRGRTSA